MAFLWSLSPATSAFLALLLGGYLVWSHLSYRRLRHVPGPKLWALTRIPLIRVHITGEIYERFFDLTTQYGPLVRIGPNYLLTSNPEVIRRMNVSRSRYQKSNWYVTGRLTPGVDNMISERNEAKHDALRKKASAGYSGKENVMLENHIDECILDLVHLIETKYLSTCGKAVNMELAQKAQYLTSDIGSKLGFDAKLNNLVDDRDNFGYIEEFANTFPKLFCTSVMPEIIDFLTNTGILKLFDPATSNLAIGKIIQLCRAQIATRFDTDGKPKDGQQDLLGSFIKHGLTMQELEQETILQMAAGSDTTATAIRATMLGIMTTPRVYERLMHELDNATKAYRIPLGDGEVISDAQARQLLYLQAVIKEGIRWYPPIVGLLAKEVPPGGDTLCGYHIPGGTIIGQSARALHFSPTLFAPDPETFRPERWLHTLQGGDETSVERIKEMERNNDLIFGWGKNQCMGKGIALIELNKIFVELLRRFDFELLNQEKPWETICYGIHLQRGLWVNVRRRQRVA